MSKFDCTEFHEQSWMHNFPKRLGTMPQSQISHELVSHQKCHNAQMGRSSPDLNSIENLRTLIKKKVSTSNPTTLDELKQIIKEIWCTDNDQNVCKHLTDSMPSRIQKINKVTTLNTSVTAVICIMLEEHDVCFPFCYIQ